MDKQRILFAHYFQTKRTVIMAFLRNESSPPTPILSHKIDIEEWDEYKLWRETILKQLKMDLPYSEMFVEPPI